MAMETPQSLHEGESTDFFFGPRIDMPVLESTTHSDAQLSKGQKRITIASRQSDQPPTRRQTDNIKEVNCHHLEAGPPRVDPRNVAALNNESSVGNDSRQQDRSKLTNRSKNRDGRMKSVLGESQIDESLRTSSKEERTRMEQRLFIEGQGPKKQSKRVTIQAGREEIG